MLGELLGSTRYFETLRCLTNDGVIASLYVIADFVLGASLVACVARLWVKRNDGYWLMPFQCKLTAVCVALLAAGYFLEIVTLFEALYRLEVVIRAAAAGVAVVIAFSCWSRSP